MKDATQVVAVELEVLEVGHVTHSTTTTTRRWAGFRHDQHQTATYHHQLEVFRRRPAVYRVNCGVRLTENGDFTSVSRLHVKVNLDICGRLCVPSLVVVTRHSRPSYWTVTNGTSSLVSCCRPMFAVREYTTASTWQYCFCNAVIKLLKSGRWNSKLRC